jgi:hypothetical protein
VARRKFRPRKHFAFGRKKRAAALDWAIDAQKTGFYADALPRRAQNVQQASLPGVSFARDKRPVRRWGVASILVPAEKVVSYKALHRKTDSSAPGKLGLARDLLDEYYAAGGK